ncbi:hypothetical protein [Undibacterium terreum]|uniref:Uncharacterized protein n=1 Tax=Undibacterium terreum TaxID=1224302 RepID=A0A916ULE3_9BURK|nr:hypothetical protein [Undibacterium terreum]GGC77457.1 hypothetical protein GCM10011396_25770 [Undibacterium terreum]
MNSPNSLILMLAMCVATAVYAADPGGLVTREIHQTPQAAGGGKPLDVRVEETARDAKTSTVGIRFVSGASVPSSMFIMHAIYDIAQARGARYFVKLSEHVNDQGQRIMLIGFSKDKVADINAYYQTEQISNLSKDLEQVDVSMFDLIFKAQAKESKN